MNFKERLKALKEKKGLRSTKPPAAEEPAGVTEEDRLRGALLTTGPGIFRDILQRVGAEERGSVQPCIALLFLVRDGLPFERIWRKWITAAKKVGLEVCVLVHSHRPGEGASPWLRRRLIGQVAC